jgi:DNA-binding protein YbaB
MTSAFESALNDMMAQMEKQREDLMRLQQSAGDVNVTARSKRRQVSVTVNGAGDIVDLKFHGHTYQTLAPNDLAKIILETIADARVQARERLWHNAADALPAGVDIDAVLAGNHDWVNTLGDMMTLPQPIVDILAQSAMTLDDGTDVHALFGGGDGEPVTGDASTPTDQGSP